MSECTHDLDDAGNNGPPPDDRVCLVLQEEIGGHNLNTGAGFLGQKAAMGALSPAV